MSTIYSIICISFVAVIISAKTSDTNKSRDIYSGTFINVQRSSVECYITYAKPSGELFKSEPFTIDEDNNYLVGENLLYDKLNLIRTVIKEVHCGKLQLKSPFNGTDSSEKSAKFYIKNDRIVVN